MRLVMRLDSWAALSMVPGAWSVSCADWWSFVLVVGVPCLLCFLAVLGVWSFLRVTHPMHAAMAQACLPAYRGTVPAQEGR